MRVWTKFWFFALNAHSIYRELALLVLWMQNIYYVFQAINPVILH